MTWLEQMSTEEDRRASVELATEEVLKMQAHTGFGLLVGRLFWTTYVNTMWKDKIKGVAFDMSRSLWQFSEKQFKLVRDDKFLANKRFVGEKPDNVFCKNKKKSVETWVLETQVLKA